MSPTEKTSFHNFGIEGFHSSQSMKRFKARRTIRVNHAAAHLPGCLNQHNTLLYIRTSSLHQYTPSKAIVLLMESVYGSDDNRKTPCVFLKNADNIHFNAVKKIQHFWINIFKILING